MLLQALKAQQVLAERYDVAADVWSATSFQQLRNEALEVERWNRLHPDAPPRSSHLEGCFAGESGVFVAASDYLKALPDSLARWLPGPLHSLGTDGFGRSDRRESLRDHFEVDARHVALAALYELARAGRIERDVPARALRELEIDPERRSPMRA
jgi:pyruvate dehydrogenase E1 component